MQTPEGRKGGPNFVAHWFVYDFVVCNGTDELQQAIANINYHGFDIVAMTQSGHEYTVLFRRLAA